VFDRSTCHLDWPVDQLDEAYCAEVSGLNFHLNYLSVWAAPSPRGAVVTRTEPDGDFVRIENRTAVAKRKTASIWISREPDENLFTMRGFLTGKGARQVNVTVCEPAMFFGQYLADRLRKAGVGVRQLRLARPDEPAAEGEVLGPVIGTPIQVVLNRCNRDSENLYAESLLKRVGHKTTGAPGSWENGGEAVKAMVARRVGGVGGVNIADGSGMSRENRVTTSVLSAWITDLIRDPKLADPFLQSLAVAGKTGTVRKRFADIDANLATIRCKTGYIDGVSSLSGVVECRNGSRVPFSIVSNGFRGDDLARARQLQEAVVKAIVQHYARGAATQPPAERPALGGG
jgi:D-alanyl-D-alanine carboxypeptidase/D-alanyl-D-alanine-endopeptidase (penicillin-binding protein 4)